MDETTHDPVNLGAVAFPFIKKHWKLILLLLIFALGFWLRSYHLDYPVIGYHNWKETHYLTEARNFANEGFFSNGFFIPAFDYLPLEGDLSGAHSDSFPTLPIFLALLFNLFGESLLLARLVVALFNAGTIIFLYLLVKELFNREDLAFLTAFLYAINPLTVFFSHNVDLINPAIFFMVGGAYFFVKWKKLDLDRDLILASLFLVLSISTKYTFALIGFPMLLLFPWSRLKKIKEHWKAWSLSILFFALLFIWFIYSNFYYPSLTGQVGAVNTQIFDFTTMFTSEFWGLMKLFFTDNFTLFGIAFVVLGAVALLVFYRKTLGYQFMGLYLLGSILWLFFLAGKLEGHSYHQYPLAPLFVFLIAFAFLTIGSNLAHLLKQFISFSYMDIVVKYLVVLGLVFLLLGPSVDAWNRQRDTQFFGLDVAGTYIRDHSLPDEKMFHSTHQSHGVLWHAGIKGYSLPNSIEKLERGEELGAKWLFIYQWGFEIMQNEVLWQRIKETYTVRQYAFLSINDQAQPIYLLLERGGSFSEEDINQKLQTVQPTVRNYELSSGTLPLYYVTFENGS